MPYSGPDDTKLPDNIKELPTSKRAQWANVWNSAYERCQRDGGKDCEGVAFRQANGVVLEEAATFTPPKAAQQNAQKALDWKEAHGNEIEEMTQVDWGQVRQLAGGNAIPAGAIKRMAQFTEGTPEYWGDPWRDAGYVAWLGWGGDEGIAWAKRTSAKLGASEMLAEAATLKKQAQRLMKNITAILKDKTLPASLKKEIEGVRMALRKNWGDLKAQADGEAQMENQQDGVQSSGVTEMYGVPEEVMPMLESWPLSFSDLQAKEQAEEVAMNVDRLIYQYTRLINANMSSPIVDNKIAAIKELTAEFLALVESELAMEEQSRETSNDSGEQLQTIELGEAAAFDAQLPVSVISVSENQNGDGLTYINVVPIRPGWGNKRDNNYYSPDLVERIAPIWNGVKMYATDHRQNEKSVLTEVSQIVRSPAGHTEDGIPYATAVIVNPQFEEIVQRRERAGILKDLHCSILAEGSARPGFELGGRRGKYVTDVTEAQSIDWVTRAGAGGSALSLAENEGGTQMQESQTDKEREVAEEAELEETVVINEDDGESTQADEQETQDASTQEDGGGAQAPVEEIETQTPLSEAEVVALLPDGLPKAARARILAAEYSDEETAKQIIESEVEYLRELGSGKPFGRSARPTPVAESEEDRNTRLNEVNSRWLGIRTRGKAND